MTHKDFHDAAQTFEKSEQTDRNIAWLFLAFAHKHITPSLITLWTLVATPLCLRFEKDFEVLKN